MNRLPAVSLLFALAAVTGGCRNTQQLQPAQTRVSDRRPSDERRSSADEDYNGRYHAESHHRHHHGGRSNGGDDNWGSYERSDAGEDSSSSPQITTASRRSQTRSGRHHNSRALTAAPGQFDFYVLNLSWSPEFCNGHPSAAECSQHRAFTLHGLWPQNNNGTYPEGLPRCAWV
jgi:ribonuclease T2